MDTKRPRFEVADVVRAYGEAYCENHRPSAAQQRVLRNITACRTAALGGHVARCDSCGHARVSYNSCRDRHCPKCQGPQRAEWLAQRLERLLPVPYFHVVFTIPHELNLGNTWDIKVDGESSRDQPIHPEKGVEWTYPSQNTTHTSLFLKYMHSDSPYQITVVGTEVIPEFTSAIILLMFVIGTLIAIIFSKRKLRAHRSDWLSG